MPSRAPIALVIFSVAVNGAQAPPAIGQNGVVNTASQIPPTLAGGSLAPGGLFTIYGVRLAGAHTTVSLTRNGVSAPVPVLKAQARQIDGWMPQSTPIGPATLTVSVDGQSSKPFPVEIIAFNPGIFSQNGEGWGPARSTRQGPRATLAVTGLGSAKEVTVVIGDRAVKAGPPRHTARPGEDEVVFPVPADAPRGCSVPVYLKAAQGRASNVVTMEVRNGTGPCDSGPIPNIPSEKVAVAGLSRTRMRARGANVGDTVVDDARISFSAGGNPALSPVRLLPPAGLCTGYTSSFQAANSLSTSISSIIGPEGRGLDAGAALILSRGGERRPIGQNARSPGNYRVHLGSLGIRRARAGVPPPFLEPGGFVLTGPGGKDVGPFQVDLQVPPALEWTDRDRIDTVDRSRGVTVHWTQKARGQLVLIVARNVDQITTAIGMCLCLARAETGRFTIPPELLANIPASRDIPGTAYDELVIGSLPAAATSLKAAGLQGGFVFSIYATGRIVEYR